MTFKPSLCPAKSPFGSVKRRELVAPGLWRFGTDTHDGFCVSMERAEMLSDQFNILKKEPRWWSDEGDDCVVVAGFEFEFDDKTCYHIYNKLLSVALWDQKYIPIVSKVQKTLFMERAKKYSIDNQLHYIKSSVLSEEVGDNGLELVMRLVRRSDGHAISVRMPIDMATAQDTFTEAEASMFLMVPYGIND